MDKKTVLFVIDDLGRGGAETLLVGTIPALNQYYNIVLVTLSDHCEFAADELRVSQRYSLGFKGKLSFLRCIFRLKKIIRNHKPALVHSHLVNSSIVLRMAVPASIPVICSLHSILSKNVYDGSLIYRNLEKMLFNKNHIVVAVTKEVLDDYQKSIGIPQNAFVLHNYIGDEFFFATTSRMPISGGVPIKCVAVGNIKKVKNYEYMIGAFSTLQDLPVELDVYGKASDAYARQLQQSVIDTGAKVNFKGQATNLHLLLPCYDLYILASHHEGFGIAAVEAMAAGLPVLLSDLPVLREVTSDNALFFELKEAASLAAIIRDIYAGKVDTTALAENGIHLAQGYRRERYVNGLVAIYNNFVFNQP